MIAIVGLGKWGMKHLKTFHEIGANVKWVFSKSGTFRISAAEMNKIRPTTNYVDILSDAEVDAVAITTNGATHYRYAKEALEAGKHVIIEKPMTLSSKEAEELARIAKGVLMVGHIHRYNPGIQRLKEDLDKGVFGKIKYAQLVTSSNNLVREDMDVIWDFLPHELTILNYLFGKPKSVRGSGASYLGKDFDAASVDFSYDGMFASCFVSWTHPLKQRTVIISGENGSAHFDDVEKQLTYHIDGTEKSIEFGRERPLKLELHHFLECIQDNKKPLTDASEGIWAVRTIEKVHEAIKTGKEVTLNNG